MDVLARYAILGAAGFTFAFGPTWSHLSILLLYPVAANGKKHTPGWVGTFYALALIPAATAAWDYAHAIGWLIMAWLIPWLVNTALLSFALVQKNTAKRIGFTLVVLVALNVPPLSAISVISPAPVAGLLFPGFGIAGLALLAGFIALSLTLSTLNRVPQLLILGALTLCTASAYATVSDTPSKDSSLIQAVQTYRGMPSAIEIQAFHRAWRFDELQLADASVANTVVFPESTFGDWIDADATMLNASKKEIIGGARIALNESAYTHVLISNRRGVVYQQRQPLPVGFGHKRRAVKATNESNGKPLIDALICIELANPWITLSTFIQAEKVVVWAANLGWSTNLRLHQRLETNLQQWAQLFGVQAISAVNHRKNTHG
ncbi:MAG: hypothetical protein V3U76_13165 [Granulosicoccus sp.]